MAMSHLAEVMFLKAFVVTAWATYRGYYPAKKKRPKGGKLVIGYKKRNRPAPDSGAVLANGLAESAGGLRALGQDGVRKALPSPRSE